MWQKQASESNPVDVTDDDETKEDEVPEIVQLPLKETPATVIDVPVSNGKRKR